MGEKLILWDSVLELLQELMRVSVVLAVEADEQEEICEDSDAKWAGGG